MQEKFWSLVSLMFTMYTFVKLAHESLLTLLKAIDWGEAMGFAATVIEEKERMPRDRFFKPTN